MPTSKPKQVSRLFLGYGAGRKKPFGSRGGSKKATFIIHPMLLRTTLILGLAVGTVFLAFPMPESYNMSLLLGDIADQDVKADRDLMVMDRVATKEKRDAARRATPVVFDLDDQAGQRLEERVRHLFSRARTILNAPPVTVPIFRDPSSVADPPPRELADLSRLFHESLSLSRDSGYFETLLKMGFPPSAERAVYQLAGDIQNKGVVADKQVLLQPSENGILVRRVYSRHETPVPYPIVFPSLDEARRLIKERGRLLTDEFGPEAVEALVAMATALVRPNLMINEKESEERREASAMAVAPVYFRVKQGEMIVREGQRVDELARFKLEEQAVQADDQDWLTKALGYFLLTAIFLTVSCLVGFTVKRTFTLKDRDLAFLSALLAMNLLMAFAAAQVGVAMNHGWPGVNKNLIAYLTPLAGGAMLATVFIGPLAGVFFSIVSSALSGLVFDGSLFMFVYCFMGALMGMSGVIRVKERSAVIKSGLRVGLVNVAGVLALGLADQSLLSQSALMHVLAGLLSGVLSGVVVTGLIPLFEMTFRYTTDVKLLELANLDRPILRELMVQAPGTYHHSVIVGAMVEAASEAIGANPLLAKVSAYYHDLGKMKKPLYFVENQGQGENRHEKLAPSMSSLILISHVKDGVELARQHKLSPEIIDIIQQHHGTSLIAYFYQKANNARTPDQPEINIEDFRYPGPKPQTREAGLVMLADSVEAASRSLPDANAARIQGMVQKLINNIFSDGQLDECELTLKDLHLIARSFNKILSGIFHRRISYPESAAKESGSRAKATNGHNVKQQAKESAPQDRKDQGQRKDDLKRLGIS
jgi:hypothetical protein